MGTVGHHIVLSDSAVARLAEPGALPTVLALLAVVLIGAALLAAAREFRN